MKSRKGLLIISPGFAPCPWVGGKRALKLARRAREFGWEPHVVTMSEGCYASVDSDLLTQLPDPLEIVRVPCRSPWQHSERWRESPPGLPRLLARCNRVMARLSQPFLPTDKYYPWSVVAAPAAASLVRRRRIDAIWASAPPLTALDLAYRVHLRTGVPFVLDFRDVNTFYPSGKIPWRLRQGVRRRARIIAAAAGITYCAPYMIQELARTYPAARNVPSALIWNWYEQEQAASCVPREFAGITILHGGTIYPGAYRFEALFKALALLREDGRIAEAGGIRLILLGGANAAARLGPLAEESGVQDMVQYEPAVSEQAFRASCQGADILLLMTGPAFDPTYAADFANVIHGKLCGYFSARRPVLVVGPGDSESGRVVRRLRRGTVARDDNPGQIVAGVLDLLDERERSGRLDLRPEATIEFEASVVVPKLCHFMEEVLASAETGHFE